jgi:hypothetical protein
MGGEAGRARSVLGAHLIRVKAPSVRKNAAHKESSPEKSHVQEQGLMAGSSHLADPERWRRKRESPGQA